jgi:hypothetical protein
MKRRIHCSLCGQIATGSREHVLPTWIRKAFDIQGPVTARFLDADIETGTFQEPHLYVPLRNMVCETCNNTWLSRLEEDTKSVLSPMMLNPEKVTLDIRAQRVLATWAFKTVSLLEYAVRQRLDRWRTASGYPASPPELAWLSSHQEPAPRSRVWLGAFNAEHSKIFTFTPDPMLATVPGQWQVPAHVTTLTVGYVAFQIFSINFVEADRVGCLPFDLTPPPPYDDTLTRIWPPTGAAVEWPPRYHFTTNELASVRNWGGHFGDQRAS